MQKKYVLTGAALVAAAVLGAVFYADSGVSEVKTLTLKAKAPIHKPVEQKAEDTAVAARVNGEVITVEEIRKGYLKNPKLAEQVSFDEFYLKAIDFFVNGKILYQAAEKANIEASPKYHEELKTAKEDLARKVYLEQKVDEKVTDEAVEKFYQDEYVKKFVSKKEMSAKHILLDNEKTAKEVIGKLNKKGDFDKLAKEYTKDKTVDLGYFTEDLMVPEFVQAVKKLKKGEYTKQPVKTQFGYHVILLEDIRDAKPLPLKDLEPQIKNILSQQAAAETFDALYQDAKVEKFDLNGNKLPDE